MYIRPKCRFWVWYVNSHIIFVSYMFTTHKHDYNKIVAKENKQQISNGNIISAKM